MSARPGRNYANELAATLLAVSRLKETQAEGESRRALREETILARKQAQAEKLRELQEKETQRTFEGTTGLKYEPEAEPFLANLRAQQIRPSPSIAPITGSAEDPLMMSGMTGMPTGGPLVRRPWSDKPATIAGIPRALRSATVVAGQLAGADPATMVELEHGPAVYPSKVREIVKGRQELEGKRLTNVEKGLDIQKKELTLQDEIDIVRNNARKSLTDAEQADLNLKLDTLLAGTKQEQAKVKLQIDQATLARQPAEAAKLNAEIANLEQTGKKNAREIARMSAIDNLVKQWDVAVQTGDLQAQQRIAEAMEVANGRTLGVLQGRREDIKEQRLKDESDIQAIMQQSQARYQGVQILGNPNIDKTQKIPLAQQSFDTSNRIAVLHAMRNDYKNVPLSVIKKTTGWGPFSGETISFETVHLPTAVATYITNNKTDEFLRNPGYPPAAKAMLVRYMAIYATGSEDPAVLSNAIDQLENVPDDIKKAAKTLVTPPSTGNVPGAKPVSEAPMTPETESLGGIAKQAGRNITRAASAAVETLPKGMEKVTAREVTNAPQRETVAERIAKEKYKTTMNQLPGHLRSQVLREADVEVRKAMPQKLRTAPEVAAKLGTQKYDTIEHGVPLGEAIKTSDVSRRLFEAASSIKGPITQPKTLPEKVADYARRNNKAIKDITMAEIGKLFSELQNGQ